MSSSQGSLEQLSVEALSALEAALGQEPSLVGTVGASGL
jgi:hypothetical protein